MNKKELSREVAARLEEAAVVSDKKSQSLAEEAIGIFFEEIKNAVVSGEKVRIRGLGTFKAKKYKAYIGRNPKTGESLKVSEKSLPVYKISSVYLSRLNERMGLGLGK